jgi:hypothetical protein
MTNGMDQLVVLGWFRWVILGIILVDDPWNVPYE